MCKVSKENKKQEAIKRMTVLGLFKPCIRAFTKYDEVQLSEPTGGLYEFSDDAELNEKVQEFEREHDALVYHVIHTPIRIDGIVMDMYNFLYVSDYEEEYDMDKSEKRTYEVVLKKTEKLDCSDDYFIKKALNIEKELGSTEYWLSENLE